MKEGFNAGVGCYGSIIEIAEIRKKSFVAIHTTEGNIDKRFST